MKCSGWEKNNLIMFHWHLYSYSDGHSPQNNTEMFSIFIWERVHLSNYVVTHWIVLRSSTWNLRFKFPTLPKERSNSPLIEHREWSPAGGGPPPPPQDWCWTFGIPWLVHIKHACLCSSRARWPVVPNFCSRATRNLSFFIGIIYAGHTGFHKFIALGSHQFFLEHSLALYIRVIMIIIK